MENKTYWNNNGRHQEKYNELFEKLVPAQGDAETEAGEIIRIAGKFYNEWFNNGNMNATDIITTQALDGDEEEEEFRANDYYREQADKLIAICGSHKGTEFDEAAAAMTDLLNALDDDQDRRWENESTREKADTRYEELMDAAILAAAILDGDAAKTAEDAAILTEETIAEIIGETQQFIADVFEADGTESAADREKDYANSAKKFYNEAVQAAATFIATGAKHNDWEKEIENAAKEATETAKQAAKEADEAQDFLQQAKEAAETVKRIFKKDISAQIEPITAAAKAAAKAAIEAEKHARNARQIARFYKARTKNL